MPERPPMAGICKLVVGLQAPNLAISRAISPIVSGGCLKYSRFWETATRDGARSALLGGDADQTAMGRRICPHDRGSRSFSLDRRVRSALGRYSSRADGSHVRRGRMIGLRPDLARQGVWAISWNRSFMTSPSCQIGSSVN